MLETYFFVPADKPKFIEKAKNLVVDYIVYDLEDAVSLNNKIIALDNLLSLEIDIHCYVRIPHSKNVYTKSQIQQIFEKFEGRIIMPKVDEVNDLLYFEEYFQKYNKQMIILIESAKGYITLQSVLSLYEPYIKGLGFGTHDFTSSLMMEHTLENLMQFKRNLIVVAKAFEVEYIDSVDLAIHDGFEFKREALEAYKNGAIGKFLIHPNQIDFMNEVEFYSKKEIEEYMKVYEVIKDIDDREIEVYTINGVIYEKPHIEKLKRIIKKIKK